MPTPTIMALRRRHLALLAAGLLAGGWPDRRIRAAAARIVAAGGVITEILYALGLADQLVGVDATSLHPPDALATKPNIGYVRALSAEGILSLTPTLVIAIESAGPPEVLRLIADAGVPIHRLDEALTPDAVSRRIEEVGLLAGAEAQAQALAAEVAAQFAALAPRRAAIRAPKRVLFILSLQGGRAMVGGSTTSADAMIRLAGAENAAAAVDGYKPVSDEAVIAMAPELLLTIARGGHAIAPEELFALPAFAAIPAAATRAVITMDGLYLLGFGPRTPHAVQDLMDALYPDTAGPG
jgi:iron complex transport system substrate-binding protein